MFFAIRFHQPGTEPTDKIEDPDQTKFCELMDGRDAFLTHSRQKNWEFSSLRRAMFSSLSMLVELHNHDRFMYNCNMCSSQIITKHHCTVCEVCWELVVFSIRDCPQIVAFLLFLTTLFREMNILDYFSDSKLVRFVLFSGQIMLYIFTVVKYI